MIKNSSNHIQIQIQPQTSKQLIWTSTPNSREHHNKLSPNSLMTLNRMKKMTTLHTSIITFSRIIANRLPLRNRRIGLMQRILSHNLCLILMHPVMLLPWKSLPLLKKRNRTQKSLRKWKKCLLTLQIKYKRLKYNP